MSVIPALLHEHAGDGHSSMSIVPALIHGRAGDRYSGMSVIPAFIHGRAGDGGRGILTEVHVQLVWFMQCQQQKTLSQMRQKSRTDTKFPFGLHTHVGASSCLY